jgi:flavin reductase (DIM6/NTAB) family NADH-FMN oxidoreductase RutF
MAEKDTLRNIRATQEFVINTVSEDVVKAMNITATDFPPDTNEFEQAALTALPSLLVSPPRVGESKVSFECKLVQIIEMGIGVGSGAIVLGEALCAHIRDDIVYDGDKIDTLKYRPVGRLAGSFYCRVADLFELVRPAPEIKHQEEIVEEIWQCSSAKREDSIQDDIDF